MASINYRLSQHAVFPAQIEDCQAAIRWLRTNAKKYGFDPDYVGVWGASAGGHLAALLGTMDSKNNSANLDRSARVQAVVDWFGPADFLQMGKQFDAPDTPVARLIGGPIRKNRDKAERASPVTYVGKAAPPFLIMHGDKDAVVPLGQSELLADALKKAEVKVTLHVIHGAGHGGPQFDSPENRKLVAEFFDQNLRRKAFLSAMVAQMGGYAAWGESIKKQHAQNVANFGMNALLVAPGAEDDEVHFAATPSALTIQDVDAIAKAAGWSLPLRRLCGCVPT